MGRGSAARCLLGLIVGAAAVPEDLDSFLVSRVGGGRAAGKVAAPKRQPPTFVRALDRAIPPALLPRLLKDAEVARALSQGDSGLKYGKKVTYFHSVASSGATPRFASEEAIEHLRAVSFDEGEFGELGIVGAEWWYQVLPPKGSIGFHYDKDEGAASDQMRMVFPRVSTVTYLTPVGGPTVVLNMTTVDGNRHSPPVAAVGHLSYPVLGRHLMFDGRLVHGVLPVPPDVESGTRVTLLVNWWTQTPLLPNCRPVNKAELARFVSASGATPPKAAAGWGEQLLAAAGLGATPWTASKLLPVGVNSKSTAGGDVMINIAAETHFLWMPERPPTNGFGRIRWNGTQALGSVVVVDLADDRKVARMRHSEEPKLIYFVKAGELGEAKRVFFPAVKRLKQPALAFVAEWGPRTEALWRAFGLDPRGAPHVTIHDTQTDRMYVLRSAGNPNSQSIREFVADFHGGSLQPLPPAERRPREDL